MEKVNKGRFVTAEKVRKAVNKLQDENKKVTNISVRNILGGGSHIDVNVELSKFDKTQYIKEENNIDISKNMQLFINDCVNKLVNKNTPYLVDTVEKFRDNYRSLTEELDNKLLYISDVENNNNELENQLTILIDKSNNNDKIISDMQNELSIYKNRLLNNSLIEQNVLNSLNDIKENVRKEVEKIISNNQNK
jgi:hypothetical protein